MENTIKLFPFVTPDFWCQRVKGAEPPIFTLKMKLRNLPTLVVSLFFIDIKVILDL